MLVIGATCYYQMRKMDKINHWTYIRSVCPELCTLHSCRLFPDNKIFSALLVFLHERIIISNGQKVSYKSFLEALCMFVSAKSGFLFPHVFKLMREEKTDQTDGFKNILDGILTIRMGAVIEEDELYNLSLRENGNMEERRGAVEA